MGIVNSTTMVGGAASHDCFPKYRRATDARLVVRSDNPYPYRAAVRSISGSDHPVRCLFLRQLYPIRAPYRLYGGASSSKEAWSIQTTSNDMRT